MKTLYWYCCLSLAWLAFVYYVIGFTYAPLEGIGDQTGWEYTGYFLYENLRFTPFPTLTFFGDQTFYPYGISSVFMSWGLERDYFYALFRTFFGIGPWLQSYYALSLLITCFGSFFLLRTTFGNNKSACAALAISFLNAYGISKYPSHYGIAVYHWTVLAVICDYLIANRMFRNLVPSASLLLLRITFTMLCFGQELGYILGISLTSLVLTAFFIAVKVAIECIRFHNCSTGFYKSFILLLQKWRLQLHHNKTSTFACIFIFAASCYFLMPLIIQIVYETRKFEQASFFSGSWHANPLRLLIPYFPFLDPASYSHFADIFHDNPEGFGASSPGWFLLALATAGLWQQRRFLAPLVPLLLLFTLCLMYHPQETPTLKIFPWFKYARVGQRVSVIFPTLMVLFALPLQFTAWWYHGRFRLKRWGVLGLLGVVLIQEVPVMYQVHGSNHHAVLSPAFVELMEQIQKAPGEAVLDWPFCTMGGNGGGYCPDARGLSLYGLRKYHEKKVLGAYYGRLTTKDATIYHRYGLETLVKTQHQQGCLDQKMRAFLKTFYQLNDFAGALLHPDMISPACLPLLQETFGGNASQLVDSPLGQLIFVKKSPAQRELVEPKLGKQLSLGSWQALPTLLSLMHSYYPISPLYTDPLTFSFLQPLNEELKAEGIVLHTLQNESAAIDYESPRYIISAGKREFPHHHARLLLESDIFTLYQISASPLPDDYEILNFTTAEGKTLVHDSSTNPFVEPSYLYTPPLNTTSARLDFTEVTFPASSLLEVGLDLRNTQDGVTYAVLIDERPLFELQFTRPVYIARMRIPLPHEGTTKSTISFQVSPLADPAFSWAYWQQPRILTHSPGEVL